MKCNSVLYMGWKSERSKNSGKPPVILVAAATKLADNLVKHFHPRWIVDSEEICAGEIVANAKVEYLSECYAGLSVEYKCKKCGEPFDHECLPSGYSISEFLTNVVQNCSEKELKKFLSS